MTIKKKLLIVSISTTLLVSSIALLYNAGYRYNSTPSYPIGIYKLNKSDKAIRRGKLVLLCPPATKVFEDANKRGYVPAGYCSSGYQSLIKKIAAVAGDKVVVDKFVYVNGIKQAKSRVYSIDPQGYRLSKTPKREYILKDNEIFVLSDYNELSFDSRYFGVVDRRLVQGSIYPVFLW